MVGGFSLPAFYESDCLNNELCALRHELVVNRFCAVFYCDRGVFLQYDTPCVDLFIEEECCDTRLCVTIDDGPVDGGSTTVLRQEGSMQIEGAERGQCPYDLWQHAEGYDDLQVGL